MATRDQIRAWCESTRPKDWYGICAGLTWQTIAYNGGYAPDVYPSAWAAYLATHIESESPYTAPPGAIHYWDYTDGHGNRYGHVVVDIDGGSTACLSATHYAYEYWGVSAGLITVDEQNTHGGMRYMGWSYRYGSRNQILITNEPAPVPVPAPTQHGGNMFLIFDADAGRAVADRQYIVVTVDGGQIRGRFLEDPVERAVFVAQEPQPPITACDAATFAAFLERIGYVYGQPVPLLDVHAVEK